MDTTSVIRDRSNASPMMRRLLDDYGATEYAEAKDGSVTLIGDGWTSTLTASAIQNELGGRLEDGWRLIRRADYPKGKQ